MTQLKYMTKAELIHKCIVTQEKLSSALDRLADIGRFDPPSDDEDECREILGGQAYLANLTIKNTKSYNPPMVDKS